MAGLVRGAVKIAVHAPNSAANTVLTSPGVQAELRRVAAGLQQKASSSVMRDSRLSQGEKSRRMPVLKPMRVATAFRGTIRSGVAVQGRQYGIPERDLKAALSGSDVVWKGGR